MNCELTKRRTENPRSCARNGSNCLRPSLLFARLLCVRAFVRSFVRCRCLCICALTYFTSSIILELYSSSALARRLNGTPVAPASSRCACVCLWMLTALLSFGRPLARLFRRDCLSIVLRDLSSWLLIGCCFTSVAFTVCCEQKTWELGTLVPPPRQCFLNPGHSVHVVVVFAAAVFVLRSCQSLRLE